jgi:DNA-binding Lrp family transcriptional regulator
MKLEECHLLSELLKNSRRSDRELAKVLGVSQPTVSRMIQRLEKQGVIKEYTIIPDFSKLGYEIMEFSFLKLKERLSTKELCEYRDGKFAKEHPHAEIICVNGIGLNKDIAFVSFFQDYSSYAEMQRLSREVPYSEISEAETFIVNLKDKDLHRVLSMSALAQDILDNEKEKS